MITLDKLCEIFELAADASLENKSGKLNDLIGDAYRAGITAVVQALRPVIEQSFKLGAQFVSNHVPDYGADDCAIGLIDKILAPYAAQNLREKAVYGDQLKESLTGITEMHLGDTPTGDTGDDSKATGMGSDMSVDAILPTSPASLCEWTRADKSKLLNVQWWNVGCERSLKREAQYDVCPSCGKLVKLMADASSRKNEGGPRSGEGLSVTTHTSTATIDEDVATTDEDVLIEFVRDWDYSGYPYDLNFARKLKQKLLEAGYKILSREPTEKMVDAVIERSYQRSREIVKNDWRKQWDADK